LYYKTQLLIPGGEGMGYVYVDQYGKIIKVENGHRTINKHKQVYRYEQGRR